MPIPKPITDESKNDFLIRCMSDQAMYDEFPNPKQRFVVCSNAWEESKANIPKLKKDN